MLKVALFYHSLVSDWNHGNAHFLRGVVRELQNVGHSVRVFEPEDGWSRQSLVREQGEDPLRVFSERFPTLRSETYSPSDVFVQDALSDCDLALVHEWTDHTVIGAIGRVRRQSPSLRVLFHDTHHRAVSAPEELARLDLSAYDGVLAYGASLREAYLRLGWAKQVRVWHEAADTELFYPRVGLAKTNDIVWVGNWGDDERTEELRSFLLDPITREHLAATIYGVRYPQYALNELESRGIRFGGWLPNFEVPTTFGASKATVHVPRRPYVRQLPGIPTIRVFEALACGIPLVSAPWSDTEGLFRPSRDFLLAQTGEQMSSQLRDVLHDEALAQSLSAAGLETVRQRHTCAHRVSELLSLYNEIKPVTPTSQRENPVEVLQ